MRPGASATRVGGQYGSALVVRVPARAVEGAATEAALGAVAAALGLRPRQVRLVSGSRARNKVVAVDLDENDLDSRWTVLLAGPARP